MEQLDSSRQLSLQEKLLLAFWMSVFIVSVTIFFRSSYQLSFSYDQKEIGKIDQLTDRAKVKTYSSLGWFQASSGQGLHHLDQIYTHQGAKLELELFQSGRLVVFENTLLRLKEQEGKTSVDLGQGFITASFSDNNQGQSPFVFSINGKIYRLDGKNADIQILNNKKQTNIQVLSGTLEVRSEDELIKLSRNQEVVINDLSSRTQELLDIRLVSPLQDKIFHTNNSTEVRFEWESDFRTRVRVSRDPMFKETVNVVNGDNNFFVLSLLQGTYFWRIEDTESDKVSQVHRFEIRQEVPPRWVSPSRLKTNLRLVRGENQSRSFPLSWDSDAQKHRIQVGKTLPDQSVTWVADEVVSGRVFDFSLDQSGEYVARVKIAELDRPLAEWSSTVYLHVWSKQLLTPKRLRPKNESKFTFFEKNSTQKVSWRPVDGVEQYEVRWVSPEGKEHTQIVTDSHFHLPLDGDGKYSWQVRSLDVKESSSYSVLQVFFVQAQQFDPTSPENGQLIELDRPNQQVRFEWARAQGVLQYDFEISSTESFESLTLSQKSSLPRIDISLPQVGTYFWRTRVVTKDGKKYFSRPFKVTVMPTPPPKKPKIDGQLKIEYLKNKNSFWLPRLWDLLFASAYASPEDESQSFPIKISWPEANENIKAYRVRIYQEGQAVLVDTQVNEAYFIWDKAFAGSFFWEVAYIDFWDRVGPFSEPEKFDVISQLPREQSQQIIFKKGEKINLVRPVHGLEVAADAQILFEWSLLPRDAQVDFFLFEIAQDLGFGDIVLSRKIGADQFKTVWTKSAQVNLPLYWRVTAYQGQTQTRSLRRRLDDRKSKRKKESRLATQSSEQTQSAHRVIKPREFSLYYQTGQWGFKQTTAQGQIEIDGLSLLGFSIRGEHESLSYRLDNQGGKVFSDQSFRKTSLSAGHRFLSLSDKLQSSVVAKVSRNSSYFVNAQSSQIAEQITHGFAAGLHIGAEFGVWEVEARGFVGSFFELALESQWHLPWLSLSVGVQGQRLSRERELFGASFAIGRRFIY